MVFSSEELLIAAEHAQNCLEPSKLLNPSVDTQILRSALIYQKLLAVYLNETVSVAEIVREHNGEIGKLGFGNGRMTSILEKLFGRFVVFHIHSAFHDAYGRFYKKYRMGRGYTYPLSGNCIPSFVKRFPFAGNIVGLVWASKHKKLLRGLFEC